MKKTISLLAMLLLAIGMVSAYSVGHSVHKEAYVTGEWKWVDDHWESGNWVTAVYTADYGSPTATSGYYIEPLEVLGEWTYDLEAHYGSSDTAQMVNSLHTWTVNPPETTPGEEHTAFTYTENNYGTYSSSSVNIVGNGQFDYESTTIAEGSAMQDVWVDIN